jgi:hypothetical protein
MVFLIGENHMIQTQDWEATGDNTYFRKARKQHCCWGGHNGEKRTPCSEPILSGSPYVEYVGEVPAFQSGHRYHYECARQQGLIRATDSKATQEKP